MAFDKRENAKKYTPQEGDTLQAIAERESAAGNEIAWQEIAKFNWGADDPDEVNAYLRDELGCRKRDEEKNFVISVDDEPQGELLIPLRFKQSAVALKKIYTVKARKKVSPPQFLECCSIPGITFAFDKSFVRPSVVEHIKPLEEAIAKHPDAKIMVFGHTDKVGDERYNKKLSERRAKSVYAFITDDADTWEALYNEERWGIRVIQEILKDLGFDPGPADGVKGPKTEAAIKAYQSARGLTVDGIAGPQTRKQMFTEYMTSKHDVKLTPEQFMDPKHMGCGEFNPVEETEAAHEPNRRVTFYLFHKDRLPKLPCQYGDIAPCRKQMDATGPRYVETFYCSFYDSIAKKCGCEIPIEDFETLTIRLLDIYYQPMNNKEYTLEVANRQFQGVTSEEGIISHAVPSHVNTGKLTINKWSVDLTIRDLESVAQIKGAQARLNNLGFYVRAHVNDQIDENFRRALQCFQTEYQLEVTGELDEATKQKLEEVHGC
jgi:outer membrane protein OmpA-like peptidoglycan-associated protein